MLDQTAGLKLHLYGRFRLETANGVDVAPKSAKSQALLALLATSETGGRGRLWLQKRLWPGKPADKASTSLRQSLSEIRRHLGDYREFLVADRRSVTLQLEGIEQIPRQAGDEFLEGIQLADGDHGIGDWLLHYRALPCDPVAQAPAETYIRRAVPN